jgi:hypothetical protein
VSRGTQDTAPAINSYVYRTFTSLGQSFQIVPLLIYNTFNSPTTPAMPEHHWFGLFPVRSPLLGKSLLFSLPPGT